MDEEKRWMIYGAYGSTGRRIVQNACSAGARPILAGRNPERVHQLGIDYELEGRVFDLSSPEAIRRNLADVDLLVNVAGPYQHTWKPLVTAALDLNIHYIDVAGELSVLHSIYELDDRAKAAGVALVPACGFDVVPTDTLIAHVAERVPNPVRLELVLDAKTTPSGGTIKAALAVAADGGWIRYDGSLIPQKLGTGVRHVDLPSGRRQAMPVPLAELESAWRTTGIGSIRTSIVLPEKLGAVGAEGVRIAAPLMKVDPIRRLTAALTTLFSDGGSSGDHRRGGQDEHPSLAFAQVTDEEGRSERLWLRVERDPYDYTAISTYYAVERILSGIEPGAHTPTQAFGKDVGIEVDGTRLLEEEELFALEGVRPISIQES